MPLGLSVALMVAAQAAAGGAQAPAVAAAESSAGRGCESTRPTAASDEIVVCVERMDGYRINPDVMAAKRARRGATRPKPPDRMADRSCETVGPMGCRGTPAIDLLGAAVVAGQMAAAAARGEDVGKLFVTDPTPSEYELYLEAKRQREEREAADSVKAFMTEHRAAGLPAADPKPTAEQELQRTASE